MFTRRLRHLGGIGALLAALGTANAPFAQDRMSPAKAIEALKQGGYIVYFRHFETGADTPDQHLAKLGDCATQRQLNEQGVRQAVRVRNAVQALNLPVGEVLASPFCRAWQSADIVFGRHAGVAGLKLPPSKDYGDEDRKVMRDGLLPLLGKPPAPGTNTFIIAHDDNMPAAGGPEIKTQGEAVIVKPDGKGGFAVVAQIKPARWTAAADRR